MKKIITFAIVLCLPAITKAKEYSPLIDMPGDLAGGNNIDSYINNLYVFAITIAGLLAVIKIIVGGVKWMMSDVVTQKAQAIKDIQSALLGLIIVLSAVVILSVINPNLVKVDLSFNKAESPDFNPAKPVAFDEKYLVDSPISELDMETIGSDTPDEQKKAFEKRCLEGDGKGVSYIESVDGYGNVHCFKYDQEKKTVNYKSLPCSPKATKEQCEAAEKSLKNDCESKKNGQYYPGPIDKNGNKTFVCIQDRF